MSARSRVRLAAVPPILAALAVAALDVTVRLPRLGQKDLWLDEAVGVHIAQLGPAGVVAASRGDTTPPLYYLVLAAFERVLGISEWAVRLPSVLASGALGAALFLVARRRIGAVGAWTVSALFLVSDVHLAFSHEARPYTLVALLCVISFAIFLEARRRGSWRWWLGLAAANAAMVFTHYVAAYAVAAQGLLLLAPAWRRHLPRFVAVHVPVAAALVAWLVPVLGGGQQHKMEWLPAPGPAHVAKLLGWYTNGLRGFPAFLLLLLVTIAALVAARRRGDRTAEEVVPVFATWAFAPLLLSFAASHAGFPSFHFRYLLYASCGLLLLWGAGVQALPSRRWRAAALGLALLASAPGLGRSLADRNPEWRRAAALVHAWKPARTLVFPYFELTPFAYQYDRAAFEDARHTDARLAAEGVHRVYDASSIASLDLDVPQVVVVQGTASGAFAPIERALAARGLVEVESRPLRQVILHRLARATEPRR